MPSGIVAPMVASWFESTRSRRDARFAARSEDAFAKAVAIISLVGDHSLPLRKDDLLRRDHVVALSRRERELQRAAFGVHQRGHLAVKTSLGAPKALILLPSGGIGGVLMNLHVRRIQVAKNSITVLGQGIQNSRPKSSPSPARPARINRTPGAKVSGKISPGTTAAQNINHCFDHETVVLGRAACLYRRRFPKPITLIFLAAPKSGPAKPNENQ